MVATNAAIVSRMALISVPWKREDSRAAGSLFGCVERGSACLGLLSGGSPNTALCGIITHRVRRPRRGSMRSWSLAILLISAAPCVASAQIVWDFYYVPQVCQADGDHLRFTVTGPLGVPGLGVEVFRRPVGVECSE